MSSTTETELVEVDLRQATTLAATVDILAIETAAETLAQMCRVEMQLEDDRPLIKAEAVRRIMARDSVAATPAEKIVESDELYMEHRRRQYGAVVEKQRAHGRFAAATLRARLSVALAEQALILDRP